MSNPTKTKELKGIIECLIFPLLKHRPENFTHHNWLDFCFATDHVLIERWKCVEKVEMTAGRQILLDGFFSSVMKLKRGDVIFTRYDTRSNGQVTVQVIRKKSQRFEEERVYRISQKKWRKLQAYLLKFPFTERDRPNTIDWSKFVQ